MCSGRYKGRNVIQDNRGGITYHGQYRGCNVIQDNTRDIMCYLGTTATTYACSS